MASSPNARRKKALQMPRLVPFPCLCTHLRDAVVELLLELAARPGNALLKAAAPLCMYDCVEGRVGGWLGGWRTR